jgi:hypothetical protein
VRLVGRAVSQLWRKAGKQRTGYSPRILLTNVRFQSGVNCFADASCATADTKCPSGNASDLGDNAAFEPRMDTKSDTKG